MANRQHAEHELPPDTAVEVVTAPPSFPFHPAPAGRHRRIAIAVDLSDESAYAARWAVQNYLRPGDDVVLLHVRPTSGLYGADWGAVGHSVADDDGEEGDSEERKLKREEDFHALTETKLEELARPLVDAGFAYERRIVKDHDMKERICLEAERLGLSAMIMGSRGFGALRRSNKGRLGSVSDYCVHHCVCPVVVVRYPDGEADEDDADGDTVGVHAAGHTTDLFPVSEELESDAGEAEDK